jgi:hypothetical protein
MKQIVILIGYLLVVTQLTHGQDELCESCIEYTLEITDNKLQGSSQQFAGYDVSMDLPPDFSKDSLSIKYLFRAIRNKEIRGKFIFPKGHTTKIKVLTIVKERTEKEVGLRD